MILLLRISFFLVLCLGIEGEALEGTILTSQTEIPALVELPAETSTPLSPSPTCQFSQKGLAKRRIDTRLLPLLFSGESLSQRQFLQERFSSVVSLTNTQSVPRYLSLQVYRL
jgi:hypothetical protein